MPGLSQEIFWFKEGSLFKGRGEGIAPTRALTTSEQLPPKPAIWGESGALGKGGAGLGFWVLLVTSRSYHLPQGLLLFPRDVPLLPP